jgi:hypothetical protein
VANTAALPARPYESPLRRAQAESTRAAVLAGAAALFVRDGYLRTTMKAIAADRGEFSAALAHPSAAATIEAYVRALAHVAVRAGGLLVAFEDAASGDASTAGLWAAAEQQRRADCRRLVQAVADRGPLPLGWNVETATDAVWLVATPRRAHIALETLGWDVERLVDASTRQIAALLIPSENRNPA